MEPAASKTTTLQTVHYRSTDPVRNFRVRVCLHRVTLSSQLLESGSGQDGVVEDDNDDYVFSWQEKILSRREEDLYGDRDACFTPLAHQYCTLLAKQREKYNGKRPTKRLFSYIDNDEFVDEEELTQVETTSLTERSTLLAERMATVRRRHIEGNMRLARTTASHGRQQPVATWQSDNQKAAAHVLSTPWQCMYIMADLTPNQLEPTSADEFILCSMKVDGNGVVSLRPDFNNGCQPYRLETHHNEVFEFTIEHVSAGISRQAQQHEEKMVYQLYQRHVDILASTVGSDFESPPPEESVRVLLLGEIVHAENFDRGSLFVHYLLNLPEGWTVCGDQSVFGTSQLCSAQMWSDTRKVHFALPLEFELLYCDLARNSEHRLAWPELFIEVVSIDMWHRQRVEGYTHVTLPSKAGTYEFSLEAWRPLGHSRRTQMQRFFVGGTPELDDITYVGIPSGCEGERISKYGFRTATTGNVGIRMHLAHQSNVYLSREEARSKISSAVQSLGHSALQSSLAGVVDAFQRAKRRMQSVRKALQY